MIIDTDSKVPFFLSIKDASQVTGMTVYNIRQRIASGNLPYVCLSNRFYINMPAFIKKLEEESMSNMGSYNENLNTEMEPSDNKTD